MASKPKIHIGTSGWHYDHWLGPFYPKDLPKKEMLSFYCKYFSTVELNSTFYRLPTKDTFQSWGKTTPENFLFSVKASRLITHLKKLKAVKSNLDNFLKASKYLKGKLGPYLFLLPPNWRKNIERLQDFLALLPKHPIAIEFRDTSWFHEEVFSLLAKSKVAFCLYEFDQVLTPKVITADFIYIRLHGPKGAYRGKYSKTALKKWADDILRWTLMGKEIYCYFDNDEKGYAPINALQLKEIILSKDAG